MGGQTSSFEGDRGDYLYHYTDAEGAKAIVRSGYIEVSSSGRDAAFGEGVYLTAIPPTSSDYEIVLNNYDDGAATLSNPSAIARTGYVIAIPKSSIPGVEQVSSGKRDVWLYRRKLTLAGKGVRVFQRK